MFTSQTGSGSQMSAPQSHDKQAMLDFANSLPFFKLIGLRVVDLGDGYSKTEIAYRNDLCQPAGIMHGGLVATLVDTGIAHALLLTNAFREIAGEGGSMVSVDLRIKYFRPVSEGVVTCVSTIPRLGRHIIHGESVVTNEQGKEVARGDSIYMMVHPTQLRGARPREA
jgi:acyl-CoA thioesterase